MSAWYYFFTILGAAYFSAKVFDLSAFIDRPTPSKASSTRSARRVISGSRSRSSRRSRAASHRHQAEYSHAHSYFESNAVSSNTLVKPDHQSIRTASAADRTFVHDRSYSSRRAA